ncbi:MAG: pilus assembly protein TadG-related protein [Erythrobacter sp.]
MAIKQYEGTGGPLGGLIHHQQGSVYAMLAAAVVPMIGFAGIGLDLGRAYTVSSRLQSGVDAAVLAAVRTEQVFPGNGNSPGPRTVETVRNYLNANVPSQYLGMTATDPVVSVERQGEEITVSVSINSQVPTSLMRVFGFQQLPVAAEAVGVAGRTLPRAVEAMMVLDVTGSMEGNGGMVALRASIREFLDIVYGQKETRKNFAIGMIPYATHVNVGRLLPSNRVETINGFSTRAATDPYGWKGCVHADPTIFNLSSDIQTMDAGALDIGKEIPGDPGVPLAKPFMYPPLWVYSFHRQDNRYKLGATPAEAISVANHEPMRTALIRAYGKNICRNPGGANVSCDNRNSVVHPDLLPDYASWPEPILYNSRVRPSNSDGHVSRSPNYVCPTEALPISYSRTKSDFQAYTNDLQPLFNIGTWHNQPLTWGYRMMTRDDVFTRARPTDSGLRQVLIFMTDGNFDSRDLGMTSSARDPQFQRDSAYSGYGSYADRRVVDREFGSGNTALNQARAAHRDATFLRFSKTCQAMKREGIEIYTITFAIANNAEGNVTRELFRTCATNRNTHFFETQNLDTLRNAFTTIAADLVDVHLAK